LPILRNPQLQLAGLRHQRAAVMARAVAHPISGALALRSAKRLVHLRFQHLLHHRTDHFAQAIRVRKQTLFDRSDRGLTVNLGHGGVPPTESGDVNNHQPAMTASLGEFAELSRQYPDLGDWRCHS